MVEKRKIPEVDFVPEKFMGDTHWKKNKRIIAVYLGDSLFEQLNQKAASAGISRSEYVRYALIRDFSNGGAHG